ncbi:NAD(P)/FAD-dependent oxidoreductase [Subtercola boreus]|uniref:FAD dependent oxidoreductase domain-containing protein n=1 Tax=Subtercola boreus TaxID=120213 RepID=A0A3E0WFI2_9MICO|nr:FAD-binding oxidoreductase [Subtercola boreus]RFA23557.1 hypothetical protein B7R24_01370 [Subtercola boreus]RFA23951.1 hypothetical protein B7R23_01370 [Subtercola boreus]RFA29649.1 hypothetical protein B7R25_01365 [Subtercola boreus]
MPPTPHHEVDIAIIGGGIAGQSLAASLGRSQRVLLLESENTLGYHTSSRSASQMQPSYGPAEIRALTAASLTLMPDIEQTLGTSILSPRPLIWCGLRGSDQQADEVVASVPDARLGSVAEAVERLPALRADALASAAFDDNAKEVDVAALLSYYQRVLRSNGVSVLGGARLTAASPEAEKTADGWRLEAGEHTISARVVVNAAGAWADTVAGLFGKEPRGLQPYRRTITVAPSTARQVDPGWPMACDVGNSFYFRSIGSDILASPLEDTKSDAEDAQPLPEIIELVKQRINTVTDLELGSSRRSWTGLRTMTPDGLPVVGRDTDDPSFYWLAGQGGYGIQTSAALGRMVAADLLGTAAGLGPDTDIAFARLVARTGPRL